jgi:hypothetical protein
MDDLMRCVWASLVASLVCVAAPAWAGDSTTDAIVERAGVAPIEGCGVFSSPAAMQARADEWRVAVDALAAADPDLVLGWITGTREPPTLARQESRAQLGCMIAAIVADAAREGSSLRLDYGDGEPESAATMRAWASRVARSSRWKDRVTDHFTRSHYRSAAGQAHIWHRKFTFTKKRSFNRISEYAAKACGLTAGHTWRPDSDRHRSCWFKKLSPERRQIEILGASSAPGLSRHHWGTDYDVFGLNPRAFLDGRGLADEYAWMREHASEHGFFQTYFGPTPEQEHTYMEERWHWSYYPVSHALLGWARAHQADLESKLFQIWDDYEARWNGARQDRPFFSHLRTHWRGYVLTVGEPGGALEHSHD